MPSEIEGQWQAYTHSSSFPLSSRFQKFGKALVLVLRNLNFLLRSVSASNKQRCVFNLSYVLMAISVELKQ